MAFVALLAEGVDRNFCFVKRFLEKSLSPSSRRAWIEIILPCCLLPGAAGRPPRGGRG